MRYLPLLLLLAGCVITPLKPVAKPEPKTLPQSVPSPVWPSSCAENWYAKAKLPACVETWIGELTNQQKTIEKKHGKTSK